MIVWACCQKFDILCILPMMNKQMMIIGGIVLVIALVGAGAFFMMNKAQPSTAENMAPVDGIESAQTGTKASIKSLIGANKNVNCTISYPDGKGSGTVYVAGAKVRGDFTFKSEETQMQTSMIQDGEYMYMWNGSQGTKMSIDSVPSASPTASTQQTADLDSEVDMDCSNWSVDESMFEVPADVKFTDMSAMMEKMQEQTQKMPKTDSSACDSIADPQTKAACVSALGQ